MSNCMPKRAPYFSSLFIRPGLLEGGGFMGRDSGAAGSWTETEGAAVGVAIVAIARAEVFELAARERL